jgi:toxin ParE1/3/4
MKINWSPEATEDLESIRAYVAEDNPVAARGLVLRIIHDVELRLPDNPRIGRPGRVPGTRELVILKPPYIVPYRVQGATIQILRVYHGARRWPDDFQSRG